MQSGLQHTVTVASNNYSPAGLKPNFHARQVEDGVKKSSRTESKVGRAWRCAGGNAEGKYYLTLDATKNTYFKTALLSVYDLFHPCLTDYFFFPFLAYSFWLNRVSYALCVSFVLLF